MQYGHFDHDRDEYVVDRPDVPVSWTNYIGVNRMCAVLSHNAGGYSFYDSAQNHRITRFRQNGVPLDRPGHYVYLRDEESGDYWSVSWQPVGKPLDQARYECRHGLSYSRFKADYAGIEAEQTVFIPVDDDVELWDVRVKNTGSTPRRLSAFSFVEFSYHHIDIDNQNLQMSLYAAGSNYKDGIIEYDFYYEPWTYHYFAGSFEPDSYDCLRDRFIGVYRTETDPVAVQRGACSGSSELGGNHCGSLQHRFSLAPGEETRFVFMLGVGSRDSAGYAMQRKYSDLANVDAAFAALADYWKRKKAVLAVKTPSEAMNTMINTWTLFQAETCVVWSRFASFVEVGGRTGLGYRDTAQDVMSVVHTNPTRTRQRIVELLRGQVSAGYGLHLFDPEILDPPPKPYKEGAKLPTVMPTPKAADIIHGLADACSDDHLWLVPSIVEWVKETGDIGFLDQEIAFADGELATVYEHMKRALDFSAEQVGPNGVCKGLRADWNDCLNLGGGETALVSFLHVWAINAFLEAARHLGREADVEKYSAMAEQVKTRANEALWDGEWYLRGFTRKGVKIGSHENEEGKIFLEHMPWAVISGTAPRERGISAMDAVDMYLFSPYGLHLNWPAYSKPDDDIGYVTRVYKGIKENASIFSHPNSWPIIAECILGRGERAMKFYDAILPYNQNDIIEIREAEPYSYCQFIMGRDHTAFGRARHPWLTGTAGWMYTAATRYILGIRTEFAGLVVDPCIPGHWKGFHVSRQWRGATYEIEVRNPNGVEKGVKSVTLNGQPIDGPVPIQPAGSINAVSVVMG
jgi:N,N'-diacetylchitobiose phosphorylase